MLIFNRCISGLMFNLIKKIFNSLYYLYHYGESTKNCSIISTHQLDILNAHKFAETSNSSFLHSFPSPKRLPDNLVYVRLPPPDELATNSVHRDRRSSKTSTGSNSKDASNPNTGSVSEGIIYGPNLINTIMLYVDTDRTVNCI